MNQLPHVGFNDGPRHRNREVPRPNGDFVTKGDLQELRDRITALETESQENKETMKRQRHEIADLHRRLGISESTNRDLVRRLMELKDQHESDQVTIRRLQETAYEHEEALDKIRDFEKKVKELVNERDEWKEKAERLARGQPQTKNWWRVFGLFILLLCAGAAGGAAIGYFAGKVVAGAVIGGVAGAAGGGVYGYLTS